MAIPNRFPWLTAAVTAVTAAVSVIGLRMPALVTLLGRDGPLISAGQLWRPLTSLLVQDGGVLGTVWNLTGLAVLGVLVEWTCGRTQWVVAYLGAGLVGELAGWAGWQPVGAGNSVAVCGLAALLAVTLARDATASGGSVVAPAVWALWTGAGALPFPVLLVASVLCGIAAGGMLPAAVSPGRTAVLVVAGSALVGMLNTDIHGAALAGGLVIAIVGRGAAALRSAV